MRKIGLFLLISMLLITGCENKEEAEKNEYIAIKSDLIDHKEYTDLGDLPLDIVLRLDRLNEEEVIYKVTLSNPKSNMREIRAMVVHNYYNEDNDTFPSIGLFDDTKELLVQEEKSNTIDLVGKLKTTKSITKLNLVVKVWIEYIDDNGEKKDIYYKTT